MIARVWRGVVATEDAAAYEQYMNEVAVGGYADVEGNRGVWMLRRPVEDGEEFMMYTLWDSIDAIKRFAGEDYATAVFYPEDERFLVRKELVSTHYEVVTEAEPGV